MNDSRFLRRVGCGRDLPSRRHTGGAARLQGGLVLVLLAISTTAGAQVQRSFINLGFEQPAMGPNCFAQVPVSTVPGWRTTHSPGTGIGCGSLPAATGPLVELWSTPFNGLAARAGEQFAELNAQEPSRIYQSVCLVNGETVAWRFSHTGRNNAVGPDDVAEFNVNNASNTIFTARTRSNGASNSGLLDCISLDGGVTLGICNASVQSGAWRDYSGRFTWTGGSGVHDFGFASISTAGGGPIGNFIDNINVTLKPFVEFDQASYTLWEPNTTYVRLRVVGEVTTAFVVPITASGGTATATSDFTVGNVTVPAGDYGAGELVPVPFTVVNDTLIEDNETVSLRIAQPTASSPYVLSSTSTCGGTGLGTTVVTIGDNDIDLRTTKTVSTPTPVPGVPFTFTVTFANNTARSTVAPLHAHDANVDVLDALPAGLTFTSWICTASGSARCPTVISSGAINDRVLLRGGAGAAGDTLTYTISATASNSPTCSAVTNTATIAAVSFSQEGLSVQAGFTSPAPGGTANNTATAAVTSCSAALRVQKALPSGRVQAGDQFTLSMTGTGAPAAVTTTGTGSTIGSAALTHTTAVPGSSYTLSEAAAGTTVLANYTSTYSCTNTRAGGQTPSGSGTSFSVTPVSGDDLTCTFRNTAPVMSSFGTCDGRLFRSEGSTTTGLYGVGTSLNPLVTTLIGPTSQTPYDAIGYHPTDHFLYGISGGGTNNLVRVGSNGNLVNLGPITNLPLLPGGQSYVVGEIGSDGFLYVMHGAASTNLYRIDLATRVATLRTLSSAVALRDFAWVNGTLYTANQSGQLVRINPAGGAGSVTVVGSTGVAMAGEFGSMYGGPTHLYGYLDTGRFYTFDLTTGAATLVASAPSALSTDGAHCATVDITFAADLAITKTDNATQYLPGSNVVYTLVVGNNGLFGAQGARVQDALPAGITTANWTCVAANGAACRSASGSGAIDALVDLPFNSTGGAATATFTLTMAVPSGFTGNLVNTATVTAGAGTTDSNTANNTATDTDTAAPAMIRVQKALPNGRVQADDQFTLSMTGTGAPAAVVTTGTGSTVSSAALVHASATLGAAYTLSEGASGTTVLANYASTYACTNARTGGQAPSGSGTSFSITPVSGDDLTCTFRNTAPVMTSFGSCDGRVFLSQGDNTVSGLYSLTTATNPIGVTAIGSANQSPYNAIGFHPTDHFIYGIAGLSNTLVRVGSNGNVVHLGPVANLPVPSVGDSYISGAIGGDGFLYVHHPGTLYRIDVATRVATAYVLPSATRVTTDLAWVAGFLYGVDGAGQLIRFTPTGTMAILGATGVATTSQFGAMYGSPTGLYGNYNAGGFYKFDVTTGAATRISDSPSAISNDGAHCTSADITFAADLAITKTDNATQYLPGSNVVYTVVVSNNGPFGAQGARVQDALPAGITTANWTCVAANGAACRSASGSGAIDALVDLPFNSTGGAATAAFTLTMAVPSGFTGNLVNTATVTAGAGTTDSNTANNTATDTDTPAVADLSMQKTATPDPVVSGGQVVFTLVVRNNGPAAANGATVQDPAVAGLDCVAAGLPAPTCTATGGASCPSPLTVAGLQAGAVIPALPNGGVVTLGMTCRVTASGLP